MNDRRINHRGTNRMSLVGLPNTNNSIPEVSESLHRKIVPLKRNVQSANYVVGLISFEEQRNRRELATDEVEIQEAPAKDIAPPYILCMNFSQVKQQDKAPEIDLSQDNKINESLQPGSLIERENGLFKLIMDKFWDYQTRMAPCCEHAHKFWEWVFTLWPESKFKWNFKNFDKKWFEYMISFAQFRETFRKWILENEDEIIKDLEKKPQFQNKPQRMVQEIKNMISDLNHKLYTDQLTEKFSQEEFNHSELRSLINNGGILVTYDPAVVTSSCEKNINEKFACNIDTESTFLKTFNKSLKKKRDRPVSGVSIFKYTVIEPNIPSGNVVNNSEKDFKNNKIGKNEEVETKSNYKSFIKNDEEYNLFTIHMNMEVEPNDEQIQDNKKMETEK